MRAVAIERHGHKVARIADEGSQASAIRGGQGHPHRPASGHNPPQFSLVDDVVASNGGPLAAADAYSAQPLARSCALAGLAPLLAGDVLDTRGLRSPALGATLSTFSSTHGVARQRAPLHAAASTENGMCAARQSDAALAASTSESK